MFSAPNPFGLILSGNTYDGSVLHEEWNGIIYSTVIPPRDIYALKDACLEARRRTSTGEFRVK